MAIRILIGESVLEVSKQLSSFLQSNGFMVIGEAQEGHELLRKAHTFYPDIVILDDYMKGLSSNEAAAVLVEDGICPVIVFANEKQMEYFSHLFQNFNFACITKPVNRRLLLQTIDLLTKASMQVKRLEKQVESLKERLDTNQEIDKAKRLLMKHMNLSEQEAHRRIQKQSMDSGNSKLEVAKSIILSYNKD